MNWNLGNLAFFLVGKSLYLVLMPKADGNHLKGNFFQNKDTQTQLNFTTIYILCKI